MVTRDRRTAKPSLGRDGGPALQAPTRKGFGGRIIEQMIGQLKGKTHFDWRAGELVCEITLQL